MNRRYASLSQDLREIKHSLSLIKVELMLIKSELSLLKDLHTHDIAAKHSKEQFTMVDPAAGDAQQSEDMKDVIAKQLWLF